MRRVLVPALALVAAGALASMAGALAASTGPLLPTLAFKAGVSIGPQTLPKREFAPASAIVFAKVRTTDGTHPSALRELVIGIDRDVKIDARNLPTCRGSRLQVRDPTRVRRDCRSAIVGSGGARFEIAFPDQTPLLTSSPITVFNGGTEGGETTLFAHAVVTIPVPAEVIVPMKVSRRGPGLQVVARVPVIASGSGSVLDFRLRLGRSFAYESHPRSLIKARCPDGKFDVVFSKVTFRNEASVPRVAAQTIMKGRVLAPCTPKG